MRCKSSMRCKALARRRANAKPQAADGIRMKPKTSGGGWAAIWYTLRMANRVGWRRLWQAMRAKNTCKTCALGMGGQAGGMRNELGYWPEVCKKSFQAMVADMQAGITPEFFSQFSLAQLQTLSSRELEWCGRLTTPLYAGPADTHYRVVDWDFALGRIVEQLKRTKPDENFFYCSGRSSNEAGFVLQLLARLYGTNYVNNCSYYCHQASGVALNASLGTSTATVTLEDVENADLYFLIGGNPASNHPRLMRTLMNLRRRGGHVVVVNPMKEIGLVNFSVPSDVRSLFFGSKIASLYVQPHIGGDIALLLGVAKCVLERGAEDHAFLANTEGLEAFIEQAKATSWELIEKTAGVERTVIEQMADYYFKAKNVVFGWTMGITHHEHGVENVHAIVNVALLRGMVGKPHAGLMPIRGHSNVQGVGSMGVAPNLKEQIFNNLEKHLKVKLPTTPGLDTMACMRAADEERVRAAICLGGNLFGSNPDTAFAHRALGKLELVTYLTTTLNTGHAWGRGKETLVLPVVARDEETTPTTQESMFNFVRLSDGGRIAPSPPAPLPGGEGGLVGPRGEVKILCDIANRLFGSDGPVNWKSLEDHCHIRQMIAQIIPGFEAMNAIDATKQEFQITGRTFHEPKFKTPTGKAKFRAVAIPPLRGDGNQLRLMTIRSEGQFNTVVYEEEDIYRGQERRDVILMSRADIDRLGLRIDQRVTVRNETGVMENILVREFDIKPGNAAMYFPEANVLVPKTVDPASKTPAFKSVLVTVAASLQVAANRVALSVVSG
jgi:molybdopterin-dependent oxidoreductase alpha subunit